MLAVLAEMERELIVERTQAGLKAARKRGRVGGRPKVDKKSVEWALRLYESNDYSATDQRYEVEVQLGPTDESHIIRTIEYWDIEHKRYPQYDHTAVIVAEDITSRFLNVISLFNGMIPITDIFIDIQMKALRAGDKVSLVFTKVLDQMVLGYVDEDEEVQEHTDRSYWKNRGSKKTLALVDNLDEIAKTYDPDLELKYNKYYIGLAKDNVPNDFVVFRPKKGFLQPDELDKHEAILTEVIAEAYEVSIQD